MAFIEHDPVQAARAWLAEDGDAALATVISTWSSAPVPVGGQMAVAPGDRFEGSISGGCVEAEVIHAAGEVIRSGNARRMSFGVTQETAWRAGLACGGSLEVYVEPLTAGRDLPYLDALLDARRTRAPLLVATDLTTGERRLFEDADALPAGLAECFREGASGIVESQGRQLFAHMLMPAIRLVIVGATEIAQVLSDLARRIGYHVVIVDPRTAFTTGERLGAIERIEEWPAEALALLGLDPRTAVIALTHAAHLDDEALAAALNSSCMYVGALGSKRSHAARLTRLAAAGFSEAKLSRIHAPIGLDIGAKGPAEIAVSILAEVVQVSRAAHVDQIAAASDRRAASRDLDRAEVNVA